jgi:osmotically-inducible protein OsmY
LGIAHLLEINKIAQPRKGNKNMKFYNQAIIAGVVAVALTGPAGAASAAQTSSAAVKVDDSAIESRVTGSLERSSLAPRDIDVDVDKGVVTLTGTVRTEAERAAAETMTQGPGVSRVINNIEVDPEVDESKVDKAAAATKSGLNKAVDATVTAGEKAKEGVQKGLGKTEEGVGKAANKTSEAVGKAGDKMTDGSITTGVKTELSGEQLLKESAIDVDTKNEVVTLRGTVPSAAARARAETIAANTKGVARVVNELVVR